MGETELIRRAAERLRELAVEATPGPWHVDGPWWHGRPPFDSPTAMVSSGADRVPVLLGVPAGRGDGRSDANVRYATAWHPPVAVALAELLELAAVYPPIELRDKAAAVARAVLGDG